MNYRSEDFYKKNNVEVKKGVKDFFFKAIFAIIVLEV